MGAGRGLAAWSLVLAGTLHCGRGETETHWSSEQVWSSAHFVYHARPDDGSVGAEVLGYLEANAGLIAQAELGLAPNAWGPVHYFKYRDAADFAATAPCGQMEMARIDGCNVQYSDGRIEVHSASAIDGHELVHAYAFSIGLPPTLLIEGLAVALSCSSGIETVALDTTNGRLSAGDWSGYAHFGAAEDSFSYVVRGLFVTWLLDRFGPAPLLAVYGDTPAGATDAELADSFQAHYQMSLDDLWRGMNGDGTRRACASIASCTALDPAADAMSRSYPAVAVPASGLLVRAPLAAADREPPAVRPCDAADDPAFDLIWPSSPSPYGAALLLPAREDAVLASSSDHSLGWQQGPVPAPDYQATPLDSTAVAAGCADVTTAIPVSDTFIGLQIWPRESPLVLQLQATNGSTGSAIQAQAAGSTEPFTVEVCTDCQGGALVGCQAIEQPGGLVSGVGSAPWIRAQWAPTTNALLTVTATF